MTYNLSPRLFVENGPAIAAQAVHRRHELMRIRLATESGGQAEAAVLPPPANSGTPLCGAVRFAL